MRAHEILNNPFLNKGTAFTMKERQELGLIGLLPPTVQTIEEQAEQTYEQYLTKPSDLEKRHFLMEIFNTNRTLFYYLFNKHIVLSLIHIYALILFSRSSFYLLLPQMMPLF